MNPTKIEKTLREHLLEKYTYDSVSGNFYNKRKPEKPAGCLQSRRYLAIRLDYKLCLLHRLAWLYHYGVEPEQHIDHIDGNGFNNAIVNLRLCAPFENGQNRGINRNNTSGFPGVWFARSVNKWCAEIMLHRVKHIIGYYDTAPEANAAREQAKLGFHKFSGVIRNSEAFTKQHIEVQL